MPFPPPADALVAAEQRVHALENLIERAERRRHDNVIWSLQPALEEARRERNRLYKALQLQCGD